MNTMYCTISKYYTHTVHTNGHMMHIAHKCNDTKHMARTVRYAMRTDKHFACDYKCPNICIVISNRVTLYAYMYSKTFIKKTFYQIKSDYYLQSLR